MYENVAWDVPKLVDVCADQRSMLVILFSKLFRICFNSTRRVEMEIALFVAAHGLIKHEHDPFGALSLYQTIQHFR